MLDTMPQEKRLDYVDLKLSQKRQVKLRTCADVYAHWRAYKRAYKKAPREGVEFQIDYIDTGLSMSEEERSRAPIALALHGAPGSYHDFSLLIQHLAAQKVRVIAPNFPEYIATVKTKVLFRHSADEKAAYLRDFLRAINVKTIDLLVSHSSAIFPTLLILLNANNEAIAQQKRERQQELELENAVSAEEQQQQQQQHRQRQKQTSLRNKQTKTHVNDDDDDSTLMRQDVNVESFSEIGSQLKEDFGSAHFLKGLGAEEAETFEDASEELDDNNNNSNNNGSKSQRGAARSSTSSSSSRNSMASSGSTANINELEATAAAATPAKVDIELVERNKDVEQDQQNLAAAAESELTTTTTTTTTTTRKPRRQQKPSRQRRGSSGLEPIVKFDEPIEIKAVALFNPAGHRMPKSMKPVWFKCGSVHVYQHKLGRSIFRKFGPPFLTVIGEVVRVENMDHVMLSATVMRNSKCQRVVCQLKQLSQMKIPTLLVFSENDKLIEKEIFYEMTQFMNLDPKNFDVFSNESDVELSATRTAEDWIRVMVFKAGGHYAYSNYAKTVNNAVSELLSKVIKPPPATAATAAAATAETTTPPREPVSQATDACRTDEGTKQ